MSKVYSNRFLIILSFLALYIIWGTTYLAIAIGVKEIPPFTMAFLRFFSAGVIMVAFVLIKGEKFPSRKTLVNNFIVGTVIMVGGQGLLFWAEQYIASGYASVLIATLPLWFIIMDKRHWTLYFNSPKIIIGLILGFTGIIILFRDQLALPVPDENIHMQIMASIAVLFGGICWVSGTIYYRSNPSPGSMYSNLGWQLISASLVCIIISLISEGSASYDLQGVSLVAWSAVVYLSIAGSIVAFVAYTWLMNEVPSAMVSTYAYVNPIIAVFAGWLIADEIITGNQTLGMIVILVSALVVNLSRNRVLIQKSNK